MELFLLVFPFKSKFLESLLKFFAVSSILGCGFLVLCSGFGNQKLIVLVLKGSDFDVLGIEKLLVLFKF